jgi:hypothetical protein
MNKRNNLLFREFRFIVPESQRLITCRELRNSIPTYRANAASHTMDMNKAEVIGNTVLYSAGTKRACSYISLGVSIYKLNYSKPSLIRLHLIRI